MQRYLDPNVLSSISGLELIAKTVVDGFVAGLHRSPNFGFSQEFAEYRAYSEGDDLRHVDWNVYARTERAYLKRYRGETNTQLTILLDTSASMAYGSGRVNKLDYTRYLAASIAYLSNQQQLCPALQPARAVRPGTPRHRERAARSSYGFREAVSALHELPPSPRDARGDLGFLCRA